MKRERITTERLLLLLILIVALCLRLYNYWDFSLSNDELSALYRIRFDNFRDLVDKGFYVDGHPGGIQVMLFYWTKLFGNSPASVRLPFVFMGVGAVYFIYKTGKKWFGATAGLLAATLLTTLEFPLLYSQIARPYGSGLFFILLLTWIWSELITSKEKRHTYIYGIAYAFSNALCMYNHYFSFLMALIIGFTGLFLLNKKTAIPYIGGAILAALLFSPHIYITLNHLSIGGVGEWLGVPTETWIFEHLFYIFNNSVWMILLTVIAIIALLAPPITKGERPWRLFAAIWFFLPLITGYIYSTKINPVLQNSVLIFSMPFFLLLIVSLATRKPDKRVFYTIVFSLFAGALLTIFQSNYYQKQHFNEFKGVAQLTEDITEQYDKDNISYATSVNHPWYLQYYHTDNFEIDYISTDNKDLEGLQLLREKLKTQQAPYFLYSWTKPVPEETEFMIRDYYPVLKFRMNYSELGEISLYSKQHNDSDLSTKADTTLVLNMDGLSCQHYDSLSMYSKGIQYHIPEQYQHKRITIAASCKIASQDSIPGQQLVLAIHDSTNAGKHWFSSPAQYFAHCSDTNNIYKVKTFSTKDLSRGDYLKVYVYNPEKGIFDLFDLKAEIYEK